MEKVTHHEDDEGNGENPLIIYLNDAQVPFLEKKRDEYQKRVEADPNSKDAAVKLIIINYLLTHKKVTLADVSEELRDVFTVLSDGAMRVIVNAYLVIETYNDGNKESITNMTAPKKPIADRRHAAHFLLLATSEDPEPNEMTDTERLIASQLPEAMRVHKDDTLKEVSYADRKTLFVALHRYILSRLGPHRGDAVERLKGIQHQLRSLADRLNLISDAGEKISTDEIYGALTYLYFNGRRIV